MLVERLLSIDLHLRLTAPSYFYPPLLSARPFKQTGSVQFGKRYILGTQERKIIVAVSSRGKVADVDDL